MSVNNPKDVQQPASQETESLVRRLAGPSSGKAGLAKDQSEINRIIADVSKGSKFYDNEKKKDKELTERINKVLKQRDDVFKGVDIRNVELHVDRLLAELESRRDLTRIIVHVDMDAFYASVELLSNPKLAGKPFAVGGGVLTTASYEARKYGVRSGMAGFVAKKLCPELIFIPTDFSKYMEMSNKVMTIFRRYDPTMYPAGCDEGYLDITSYCQEHSISADECVQEMRRVVFEETKLTVSAGIAPNKLLAKICSDRNKPNGQFHLSFERKNIVDFMKDLSIRKVPGIGRVNERLLESVGIKTCGDIFTHRAIIALMDKQFGLHFLLNTYLGIASNEVRPPQREERKSMGAERTFAPTDDQNKLLKMLDHIAAELESDMLKDGWMGKTVTLKYKLDTYQVFTRAKSLSRYVSSKEDLFSIGKELFLAEGLIKVRLIGLRVTKLKDLRAPSPPGIKRFFESANTSPRKRPKIEDFTNDAQDENQTDAMPGFYEHEETMMHMDTEARIDEGLVEDLCTLENNDLPKAKIRPPVSAPSRTVFASLHTQDGVSESETRQNSKMIGKSDVGQRRSRSLGVPGDEEGQICPICSQRLVTDNQEFNAHIDFCLSRDAIQEAKREFKVTGVGGSSNSEKPSSSGWNFLMAPKDSKRKRKR